jgi:hypothetical protein
VAADDAVGAETVEAEDAFGEAASRSQPDARKANSKSAAAVSR